MYNNHNFSYFSTQYMLFELCSVVGKSYIAYCQCFVIVQIDKVPTESEAKASCQFLFLYPTNNLIQHIRLACKITYAIQSKVQLLCRTKVIWYFLSHKACRNKLSLDERERET